MKEEIEQLVQRLQGIVAHSGGVKLIKAALKIELEAGLDDCVFAVEIVIHRARAEVGLGINIAHGGLMKAFASEAAISGIDDLLTPCSTVRFSHLGHPVVSLIYINRLFDLYINICLGSCQYLRPNRSLD